MQSRPTRGEFLLEEVNALGQVGELKRHAHAGWCVERLGFEQRGLLLGPVEFDGKRFLGGAVITLYISPVRRDFSFFAPTVGQDLPGQRRDARSTRFRPALTC